MMRLKRLASGLLAAAMLASILPIDAYAAITVEIGVDTAPQDEERMDEEEESDLAEPALYETEYEPEGILVEAYADEIMALEETAEGVTYTIVDDSYCQITKYTGEATALVVPEEIDGYVVRSIGNYAFRNCTSLESIHLPDSVETIGYSAFENCTALSEINYPLNLESCGSSTSSDNAIFKGCTNLKRIEVPEGVTSIPNYTFRSCTYLEEIILPTTLESIGNSAFSGCTGLQSIDLPEGLTTIGSNAFSNCTGLQDINLPESLITIGSSAFSGCTSLQSIVWPSTVITIEGYLFSECTSLTDVTIPEGVTSIKVRAFSKCTSLESIHLPDSVETIGYSVFENCTALNEINYPMNLNSCGSSTSSGFAIFKGCTSLERIEIPEGVTSIPDYTFRECNYLEEVILPTTLKSIGSAAFSGCTGLQSIDLPEGLTTIGSSAFDGCTGLVSVLLPKTVTSMANNSFNNCPELVVYCYSGTTAYSVSMAAGYNVYDLNAHEHQFELIAEVEPDCTHTGSKTMKCSACGYEYKEILAALGHTEGDWTAIEGNCLEGGTRVKRCTVCGVVLARETVSAGGHAFGAWVVEREATVLSEGRKVRTCEVCGEQEVLAIERIAVDVTQNLAYGLAHFTVVDATTQIPIPGASIYFSTETEGEATLFADENGQLDQVLPVGTVRVSVCAQNYQVRTFTVEITSGENEIPVIGISQQDLVTGQLTSREMTYDEIIAAGIDVSAAENKQVYEYALTLVFRPEIDVMSLVYYMTGDGMIVWPGSGGGSSGGTGGSSNEGNVSIGIPAEMEMIGDGNGGKRGVKKVLSDGSVVQVYPINERFFLIIYGEASWLKEMYDVELLVINNSQTDTVEDAQAELTLPEGLSLAAMSSGEQSLTQEIGTVASGEIKSVHWYIKGDEEGEYDLSAHLTCKMMPLGDIQEYTFALDKPLKVYAGNALHLSFYVPDSAFENEEYTVRIELENVSGKTLYNVSNRVKDIEQYRLTYYSDGTVERKDYNASGGTGVIFVREFKPGDKLVLEVSTVILFHSDMMDALLESYQGKVEGFYRLREGYKAVSAAYDIASALQKASSKASKAIDNALKSNAFTSTEKRKLAEELLEQLNKVSDKCTTDSSDAVLKKYKQLDSTGVLDKLGELAELEDCTAINDVCGLADLAMLSSRMKALASEPSEKFDPCEAIQTAISMIPVRFVLENAFVTSLEKSTTEISSSIIIENVGPHYFGISNVGKYLMELIVACYGESASTPDWLKLFGFDVKESMGYYDAVKYIQTANQQAAILAASDNTGEGAFAAWYEPSGALQTNTLGLSVSGDYELTVGNETAQWIDGKLTFTGSGLIALTPMNGQGGNLYVQMPDGTVAQYEIEVVPEHVCSSDTWQELVPAINGENGWKVKLCDTCHDVIDIEELFPCAEHVFGSYQVEVAATLGTAGLEKRVCTVCGETEYHCTDAYAADGYIRQFEAGHTVKTLVDYFAATGIQVELPQEMGYDEVLYTGLTVHSEGEDYVVVIPGDVNGDGKVTEDDINMAREHLNGTKVLDEANFQAAIRSSDQEVLTQEDIDALVEKVEGGEKPPVDPVKPVDPGTGSGTTNPGQGGGGGGCYVATAVYGSYDCPEVWTLRRYRDYELSQTAAGRAFIYTYYAVSPTIVEYFGDDVWFQNMWRGPLDRMVCGLQAKGYESTPYEDIEW